MGIRYVSAYRLGYRFPGWVSNTVKRKILNHSVNIKIHGMVSRGVCLQVSLRKNHAVHDRCVESLARRLSLDGWMVEAHIPGWLNPAYIEEYMPDVRAWRDGDTLVIEVETMDTLLSDSDQQDAFRRYAAEAPGAAFMLCLARDDLTCVYVKDL